MIVTNESTKVETTLEGKTFKIEDNVVLYNILSDRMYKNKIRAVIRELSTNAVDAQIANGNTDTPISVTLPTILEPIFKIRDYGIGLSEEDVMNLYTTYGSSTKRDSNLFNGALGLGSKSPFAYSKAFTVTSYWNGTKYMFSVYSDDGMPKIAKLADSPTDEPNGLEISIPVQDDDIYKFETEAKFVYRFFSTPIDCNLSLDVPMHERTPTYSKDNWGVYSDVGGSYIVMANVAYSITNLDISGAGILATYGLVVNVPTGAVQFSASREELSLTPETIKYLQDLSTKITKDIEDIVDEAISSVDRGDTSIGNIMKVVNTLPSNLRSKVGDKFDYLYIGYGGHVQVRMPNTYKVKIVDSWSGRCNQVNYLDGERFTNADMLFVMMDVQNRMSYIKEEENRTVIFVSANETKTKENAKTRFNDFITKFGLTTDQYKFSSEYELPKISKSTTVERRVHTPASTVKSVIHFSWTGEAWACQVEHGDYVEVLEEAENVYAVIAVRDEWKSLDYNFITYGDGLLRTCLAYNNELDKSKKITLAVYTPRNYEKYCKGAYPFWTELLPKKITATNLQKPTHFLSSLGFPVEYIDGAYTLKDKTLSAFLPKDLERLIAKMSKTVNPFGDTWTSNELAQLEVVAKVAKKKNPVVLKFIDYDAQINKYEKFIDNIWGHKSKPFKGDLTMTAALTKAWDNSYHKLNKIAKDVYGETD